MSKGIVPSNGLYLDFYVNRDMASVKAAEDSIRGLIDVMHEAGEKGKIKVTPELDTNLMSVAVKKLAQMLTKEIAEAFNLGIKEVNIAKIAALTSGMDVQSMRGLLKFASGTGYDLTPILAKLEEENQNIRSGGKLSDNMWRGLSQLGFDTPYVMKMLGANASQDTIAQFFDQIVNRLVAVLGDPAKSKHFESRQIAEVFGEDVLKAVAWWSLRDPSAKVNRSLGTYARTFGVAGTEDLSGTIDFGEQVSDVKEKWKNLKGTIGREMFRGLGESSVSLAQRVLGTLQGMGELPTEQQSAIIKSQAAPKLDATKFSWLGRSDYADKVLAASGFHLSNVQGYLEPIYTDPVEQATAQKARAKAQFSQALQDPNTSMEDLYLKYYTASLYSRTKSTGTRADQDFLVSSRIQQAYELMTPKENRNDAAEQDFIKKYIRDGIPQFDIMYRDMDEQMKSKFLSDKTLQLIQAAVDPVISDMYERFGAGTATKDTKLDINLNIDQQKAWSGDVPLGGERRIDVTKPSSKQGGS